jgi:thiol-disulfide isomerase/thioredoxin
MKYFQTFLLLLLAFTVQAQELKPFTIKGDISNINDRIDSIHISYTTNGVKYDQPFEVNSGLFFIKGNISQPVVAMIYYFASSDTVRKKILSTENTGTKIFIQPGEMTFESGSRITDNTLKGSPYDLDFKEMENKLKAYYEKFDEEYELIVLEKDTGVQQQKIRELLDSSRVIAVKVWLPYLNSNPQSPLVFYAINQMMMFNRNFQGQDIAPIYNRLPIEMQNSYDGHLLKAIIATGNGSRAPEFSQADTSGIQVSLSSFRGKYVLLDFWGSWCVFCRKEHPNLIKEYEKYKDKGFTVLSVAADEDKNKWLGAIRKDGIGRWTHVSDLKGTNNEVAKLYFVKGYPSNFLIDPNGIIIAQNLRGEDLENKLTSIFK